MLIKKIISVIFVLIAFVSYNSCNGDKDKDNNNDSTTVNFNEEDFFARIDQAKVKQLNEVIQGFASPVEIAAMVESNHIEFSKDYILSTSIINSYETSIKKALGLGLLSADLGYLNIYSKTGQMIDYLVAINTLATDLRVSQFFDFQVLKSLVTTSDNMDSLLFMTVSSFHMIDNYFSESNRSYLTVMCVTGVWLEGSYLLSQVSKDNPDKDLKEKIGSQKDLLIKLIEIIKVYEGHPQFDYLITQMEKLEQAYKPVTITTIQTEGKVEFIDGNYVIYPSEETKIEMPDGTLENIIKVTEDVRNAVVNIK